MNEWISIIGEIILTGKNEGTWRRTCPSTISATTGPHTDRPRDRKQASISDRLANNHLSHGMVIVRGLTWSTARVTDITH
jgi:hypothetical protein